MSLLPSHVCHFNSTSSVEVPSAPLNKLNEDIVGRFGSSTSSTLSEYVYLSNKKYAVPTRAGSYLSTVVPSPIIPFSLIPYAHTAPLSVVITDISLFVLPFDTRITFLTYPLTSVFPARTLPTGRISLSCSVPRPSIAPYIPADHKFSLL